jgi:hypothetical protein
MAVALSGQICGTILLVSIIAAFAMRRRTPAIAAGDGMKSIEARLSEMQQSLDAVAIEVERISEGQRFATKLLAERDGTAAPEMTVGRDAARSGTSR